MNVFMDMWKGLHDPQRVSIHDKSDKIVENINEALRLEDELEKKISRENFAIFKSIMGRRLMVSECYKYIAF